MAEIHPFLEPVDEETSPLLKSSLSSHVPREPDALSQKPLSMRSKWILASIWMGTFCAGLDGTIMATLSEPIATNFQSMSFLAWLATAYLIASAASQPLCGKLTDIYSRRTGLLVSNILFAVGNLVCACATETWMIIFGRALAGLGGGGLNTISSIILADLVPLRRRGLLQGIGNLWWAAGNGLGGVFGGFLNDVWSWRLAFFAQGPLNIISLALVYLYVDKAIGQNGETFSPRRVDFLGSFLLVSTLVTFLSCLNIGGNVLPWDHPLVYISCGIAVLLLCALIFVEEKVASEPIIPFRLLINRTVACACLLNLFFTMIIYSLLFFTPIYFHMRGLSTTKAGTALIPFSIASALGSIFSGLMTSRTGKYKYLNIGILLTMVMATISMCISTLSSPLWLSIVCVGVAGFSFGAMLTLTLPVFTAAAEHKDQATIISLSYVFRSTGSVGGVAMSSAIFQNVLTTRLEALLGNRGKNVADVISRLRNSLDTIGQLPPRDRQGVRESYMLALRGVFLNTVVLAVLALVSGLLIRELKLYTTLNRDDGAGERSEVERN